MAIKLVTGEEMKAIDLRTIQENGIPGIELMERAGAKVAEHILEKWSPRQVGIVTGKGNNAGDGLVVARLLKEKGVDVVLIMLTAGSNLSESGRTNFERLPDGIVLLDRHSVEGMKEVFSDCDVLVDAILGTGLQGAPKGCFGEAIAAMNALSQEIVAIDIPSGLDSNTGEAEGACIAASETITVGLPKLGMVQGIGPQVCGMVTVVDIGFPKSLVESRDLANHLITLEDVKQGLPDRPYDGHKGTFGSLLVLAGSWGMSGAAYLTTACALRSGCGMVYGAFPKDVQNVVEGMLVEAVKIPLEGKSHHILSYESWVRLEPFLEKATAVAVGPGIGTAEETARLVDELVCMEKPLVIDADALNCLKEKVLYLTKRDAPTVLTPHPGEMARILGRSVQEIQKDRFGAVAYLARESQSVVLLKGAYTVIAEPEGRVFVNPTGNAGMAKGGTGDVLTGLIGGLLAQGSSGLQAALIGAYVHGMAGDLAQERSGERGMTAQDVLGHIAEALHLCEEADWKDEVVL
jgi:NAD(P)H-hydrate epimerase